MRNVSDKGCRENEDTHFVFSNFSENRTVYNVMWKNAVEAGRPQMAIRMAHAHCMLDVYSYKHTLRICNIFHYNIGCTNAPQCYVIRTLTV